MATAQSKLDILIAVKQNASPQVRQLTGDLKEMDKAAGLASKGLGGIATGLGVAGLVAMAGAAVNATMELSRLAAVSQDVEAAMSNLAGGGQAQKAMLEGLRDASRGAISDYDLMLTANRAMLLGVAKNTEDMVALMDVARARSQALGVTTAQAFGDIVTGIGRESALILDNLGIVVDAGRAHREYAATLGKTASQLTDAERKQALVNAVIADSADLVRQNVAAGDDAASNFERMDAAIQNAKSALGELFQPAMVAVSQSIAAAAVAAADGMQALAEAGPEELQTKQMQLQGLNNMLNIHREALANAEKGSEEWSIAMRHVFELEHQIRALTADVTSAVDANTNATQQNKQAMEDAAYAADLLAYSYSSAASVARQAAEDTLMLALAVEQFNMIRQQSQGIASAIESAAKSSAVLYGAEQGGQAGLARQQAVTEELTAQRKLWEDQGYSQQEINDVLMPSYVRQLQEADRATFATATNTRTISQEAKEAERQFNSLRSTVEGVLSGALDHGTGVNPDDVLAALGLPREDAINENARRLADIAKNGLMGQDWLDEFAREVPDIWRMIRTAQNPQEEAAYLLRDFQDGLLTSAIDKEKAKQIVRRQILGDQNMAQLAQEIAQELAAEMGVPLQQAMTAAKGALGVGGGGAGVGTTAADEFADGAQLGMEERNGGAVMVDTFVAQIRASYSKLAQAGRDAGKQWGDGFLAVVGENIPPQLVNLLANIVTPAVMAQFAQQGSLQGAAP